MTEWQIIWCLFDDIFKYEIISQVSEKYFKTSLTKNLFIYCRENILENNIINKDLLLIKFSDHKDIIDQYLVPVNTSIYKAYIEKLTEEYTKDRLDEFSNKIISKQINTENIYSEIDSLVRNISPDNSHKMIYVADVVGKIVEELMSNDETIDGVKTYIPSLDEKLNGLKPGNYVVIAGRPSMGKTAFASHIALKNVLNNIPTLFFSLEMNQKQLLLRMFASELKIPLYKLKRKMLNEAEKIAVKNMQKKFEEMPLIIDEAILDIHMMMAKIQRARMKYPELGLIVIDYLQLMTSKGLNENEAVTNVSRGIKLIAKKFNLPVIILSQLNRLCEQRENKRPQMSDLRASGSIEQDADVIMFLYRDYYYNGNPKHEALCEINVNKFRDGEIGKVIVEYDLKKQFFKDIDHNSMLWKEASKFYKVE